MFRFLEISLHGWDLWPPMRVPLASDIVVVTGPNGSGKTTLLDAIRQLLNAKGLSSRRRVQNYLRRPDAPTLLRAVVTNDATDGAPQPFRAERITGPEVTLACLLQPGGGGSPEKRFAILGGRPSIEEVRGVLESRHDWYPPERYSRALENAGVSRSLMGILAIEQGKTNTLFERKPRDLFREVLDMLGDRAVLDRYREARARYEETQREVDGQTNALLARRAELGRVRSEVERREAWERDRDRVADLDGRLPAAILQRLLRRARELEPIVTGLRTKVSRGGAEEAIAVERLERARQQEELDTKKLQEAREAVSTARHGLEEASRSEALAGHVVSDLAAKADKASAIPEGDLASLEAAHSSAARERLLADQRLEQARDRLARLDEKLARLREGIAVFPEAVARATAALGEAGVDVQVLAETVEVADETLAAAAEAALGDARFTLLVQPRDEERAVEIARRERSPGPVYAGARQDTAARAGALELGPGSPGWIAGWIDSVELGPDGSWKDARGTWVRGVDERALGERGRKAALENTQRERDQAAGDLGDAERAATLARTRSEQAEAALSLEKTRQELLSAARGLAAARAAHLDAEERLREARRIEQEKTAEEDRCHAELGRASLARQRVESEVESLRQRLAGEREGLEKAETESRACEREAAQVAASVPAELIVRAERGELDGEDTVRADLDRARQALSAHCDPPAPEIRDERRHLENNVAELDRHLQARRAEAQAAQQELDECRRRYLAIVQGALDDYKRRARELAERAQVKLEMELPRLAVVDGDRALDEAEIHPSFGFDGKEPLPLGDPSFSGGQQVIAGLILLMAMAETERGGFFILDEPFAHLSLDRVDQVGRFLRSTRSQFIITAPTTLDRAQLDPASLVVVLRKKQPGEAHAPVPIVAEA